MRKKLLVVAITLLALTAGGFVFVWSGLYDVAADRPHTALMYSLLNTLRERSIEVRARVEPSTHKHTHSATHMDGRP